jgi:hypothetical protein
MLFVRSCSRLQCHWGTAQLTDHLLSVSDGGYPRRGDGRPIRGPAGEEAAHPSYPCEAGKRQVAHTTPVYVTVDGGGFFNPATATRYLELSEQYLRELEQEIPQPDKNVDMQVVHHKAQLERQIADARNSQRLLADRTR